MSNIIYNAGLSTLPRTPPRASPVYNSDNVWSEVMMLVYLASDSADVGPWYYLEAV